MEKTDILIIHINGEKIILDCLKSIEKNTKNCEVYLLLNKCEDNSEKIIRENFPVVKIVKSEKRLGFAEASNRLAKLARSKYILFLNNDVEVTKNWLANLLKTIKRHKKCIACQPKVKDYYKRNKFEYAGAAGGFIDKYGYPFCRGRIFNSIEEDNGQYDEETQIFWACGVCFLTKRKEFLALGGFDESFFMYAEEIDFCWRVQLAGYEVWYCPDSTIYHIGSFSVKSEKMDAKKDYLITRNHLLILVKNYSLFNLLMIAPLRLSLGAIAAFRSFPVGVSSFLKSIFKIFLLCLLDLKYKRREIRSFRKINDKDLRYIYPDSIVFKHFIRNVYNWSDLKWNIIKED